MCKVYNSIGCLTAIKSHLREHHLNEFKSVNELISFQKSYSTARQQIISHHSFLIEQERNTLREEIQQLTICMQNKKEGFAKQLHTELSPAGIFIIETKNWSERSLNNLSLRSPVEQIKRTNFALFRILAGGNTHFTLRKHHWGTRKIPLRNLIVLINHKPREEFQHVKVLTLNELLGYIEYFNRSFSYEEIQSIANYLLKLCGRVI